MYISVSDAAKKFNISTRRVQILCKQGRIFGAKFENGTWLIPESSKKPEDYRKKKAVESDSDTLSIYQVSEMLSVSYATVKNWIRLGKIKSDINDGTFSKEYIENILTEIKTDNDNRLKSRRNKKNITGNALYKDYIENKTNRNIVMNICDSYNEISESELRIILAYSAILLYAQVTGEDVRGDMFTNDTTFNILVSDLIKDRTSAKSFIERIVPLFEEGLQFVPYEDTLGFIYISLRDLNNRKKAGAYYTPSNTIDILIKNLKESTDLNRKTICDPCCGTGNFLIKLISEGVLVENIYGQDIDEISIQIARINIFFLNRNLSLEKLYSHFTCENPLLNIFSKKYSIILGNPPWGCTFSKEDLVEFLKYYKTAQGKSVESFNLFIEKGLSMLEDNGYLAYVLPESILNVAVHQKIREVILKNASFKFISYLGNVFSGVQCPSIILGLCNDINSGDKRCSIDMDGKKFLVDSKRICSAEQFLFNMSDEEYDCITAIESIKNSKYLSKNSRFALGIVTGNNKKYIKSQNEEKSEIILKGSDIFRYSVKKAENYICYIPENFQQVAPTEIYRANEKLLYRFISEVPVFAYDNNQTLSLNSCNILIPQIDGMDIKYILAILNSSVAAYYIKKKYNSVKILRKHIESLPIPLISREKQKKIIKQVEDIMNSKEEIEVLYDKLDDDIMKIYLLSEEQRKIIRDALSGKNRFL